MSTEEDYLEFTLAGEMQNEQALSYNERKIQAIAELLYEHSMRSENWTDIVPFKEASKEYKEDLISLATELNNLRMPLDTVYTGGGL